VCFHATGSLSFVHFPFFALPLIMKRKVSLQLSARSACTAIVLCGAVLQAARAAETGSPGANLREPITLSRAIRLALEHNPELLASRGRIDAAAGRAYQARRWQNPELTLAAEDVPVSGGNSRESKETIGVAQTVPYPGKKKLDGSIGAAGVQLNEAEWSLRQLELVRDVQAAFFRVLANEGRVGISRDLVAVAESSASVARKRVEAGAAPDQEQLRAEIQLDQARSELVGAERESATARENLATLLGRPDLKAAPVTGVLATNPDESLLEHGPEQWLARHPGVAVARTALNRTELELKRARVEPYPDVTFGVAGGRDGLEDAAIIEFRMGVPLPIFDRSKGRKQEAKANVGIAQAELSATEQRLLRDWGIASKRFRTAAEQVAAYRDRTLPKANKALRLVQTGFEEGKFGFIDLVDTQRTAAEVRLAYQEELLELNIAQAELQFLIARPPGQSND